MFAWDKIASGEVSPLFLHDLYFIQHWKMTSLIETSWSLALSPSITVNNILHKLSIWLNYPGEIWDESDIEEG
jgi:hypothetical protein